MSFTSEVKEEVSKISNWTRKDELRYELMGYFMSNNFIEEKKIFKYSTENKYNINRYAKILKNLEIEDFNINILSSKIYFVTFKRKELRNEKIKSIFDEISQLENIKVEYINCVLRGIFLGSGSINNPMCNYHLEISLKNDDYIRRVIDIINKNSNIEIDFKSIDNKLYLKDGQEISDFLAYIGANKSVLKFETIRVERDMNNKVNRLVNCKTANLNKTLNASVNQVEAIRKLKQSGKFNKLPENLKEIANLRLEYPDIPLSELGSKLKVQIGKSGVNYRLKKIEKLGEEI